MKFPARFSSEQLRDAAAWLRKNDIPDAAGIACLHVAEELERNAKARAERVLSNQAKDDVAAS